MTDVARAPQRIRETPPQPFKGVYDSPALAHAFGVTPALLRMWVAGIRVAPEGFPDPEGMLNGGNIWSAESVAPVIEARRQLIERGEITPEEIAGA